VIIHVLAAGIRKEGDKKDIYNIAKKLLNEGLIDLKADLSSNPACPPHLSIPLSASFATP